jgi:hypothetical protein
MMIWDCVFTLLKENKIDEIIEMNNLLITGYGNNFEMSEKYKGQIEKFMEK